MLGEKSHHMLHAGFGDLAEVVVVVAPSRCRGGDDFEGGEVNHIGELFFGLICGHAQHGFAGDGGTPHMAFFIGGHQGHGGDGEQDAKSGI